MILHSTRFYLITFKTELKRFATYRMNIFAGLTSGLVMLLARIALWAALFTHDTQQTATFQEVITFFIVSDTLLVWIAAYYSNSIGPDVRTGDLTHRLIRPLSYHLQLVTTAHAKALITTLTKTIPVVSVINLFLTIYLPASWMFFLFFILSAVLGGIIYTLIDLIIGYTVFWLTESWYVPWFKRALFVLFGGLAVPVWLQNVSRWLPFQYTIFIPLDIYLGRVSMENLWWLIGIQLFWGCLLLAVERFVWKKSQRRLMIQGG